MVKNVDKLEDKIGIKFNTKNLLIEALSHSTYLEENPDFKIKFGLVDGHNQRLEYFGDSILGHIIAEKLYKSHPGREGDLTDIKKHFVNGNKLEEISNNIGLEKFLNMGIGESENKSGREKRIRDALEALIAAIYIDQGYIEAKEFINEYFLFDFDNVLNNIEIIKIVDNPIGKWQKHQVKYGRGNPVYRVTRDSGPDHEPLFIAELDVDDGIIVGGGKNKDAARKNAAMNALRFYDLL